MKHLLIAIIILVCVSVIALVVMATLYATRNTECKLATVTYRDFTDVLLVLGVDTTDTDAPSMKLTIRFTDNVAPKPAYYLIVFRVNASQFVTRELLPSTDGFHQENVPVSYLVKPGLFEAQITRIESNGTRVEGQIYRVNPAQAMEALKPIKLSRVTTTTTKAVVQTSSDDTQKQMQPIADIDTNKLMDERATPGFNVATTTESVLVFSAKAADQEWYTVIDEEVLHWNVSATSNHAVFSNNDGLVYVLNLSTLEVEPAIKLDDTNNTMAVALAGDKCIVTATGERIVVFMKNHGVWTRLVEMVGNKFTGITINQITKVIYSLVVVQATNSTKYLVDIVQKTIIKT